MALFCKSVEFLKTKGPTLLSSSLHPVAPITMKAKLSICSRSKIYTSHLWHYTRTHGKVFQVLNAKCKYTFLARRDPQETNWTVLY